MFRKILVLLLVAGVMASFAAAGSALFTSTAAVAANTFTTGTLILTTSTASGLITYTNMAPGDKVTAPLTVADTGNLALRYAMTTTISAETGGLGSQLQLQVKSGVTACTNVGFDTDGTSIYNSALTGALIGNPAQGNQAGDRTLAGPGSEVLCFQARLPITTDNTFQGKAVTAQFNFAAEQTANNP
jgi:spore coat-associated protein N